MSSLPLSAIAAELDTFKTGIGAWLVGTFLSTLVVGMVLQQMFRYFRLYPSDPPYLKIWVVAAVLLQLVTTAFSMHVGYYYLITYYLNPIVFTKKDVWTSALFCPPRVHEYVDLSTLQVMFRSGFPPSRPTVSLYRFIRGKPGRYFTRLKQATHRARSSIQMIMILASCGFYFAVAAQAFALPNIITAANTGAWLPTAGAALLLASDFQLTVVLVYFLYRSRTGLRRTNSMLDILIAYTMSTGGLVWYAISFLNVVGLIMSITFSHNIIYTASTLVVKAVYTSSFLAALNTRQMVRSRGELYDSEDLAGGVVFGEADRDPAAAAPRVKQVELPSIAFATHPSGTQTSDMDESGGNSTTGKSDLDLEKNELAGSVHKRAGFGTVTV
ncbi:hypothetical protein VTO73DRAFT_1387 [Trametes versicolor]